jgi:hypothetical protein
LNDSSAAFRPQTFVERDCEVLLDRARLLVLGAPLRQVFVMKLFAARVRTRDYDDMVAMWPGCGFDSAEQAVELYRAAYPHEVEDPYLVDMSGASPTDSRTPDLVRSFTQSEKAADTVTLTGPGCIAAGQRLAGSQVEL